MSGVLISLAVVVGVLGLAYVVSFNRLVTARQHVADSWAAIDVELQRRSELIPGLVEAVRSSAAHERRLLDELVRARTSAHNSAGLSVAERSSPEHDVAVAAHAVIALREMYPALNTQQNFLQLQRELATTEDRLSASRRFYNIKVAALNRRVQAVPSAVVARWHHIDEAGYFQD